jgi:hypothetical protein
MKGIIFIIVGAILLQLYFQHENNKEDKKEHKRKSS